MSKRRLNQSGYTMVELTIAAAIIVVIAGIAIPAWMRARESTQRTGLINELRNNVDAFQNYETDHNNSPPPMAEGDPQQQIPPGMEPYMPKNSTWTTSPLGGGYWVWVGNSFQLIPGYNGFICVTKCGLSQSQIQEIDSLMDDGNSDTGAFRTGSNAQNLFLAYGIQ